MISTFLRSARRIVSIRLSRLGILAFALSGVLVPLGPAAVQAQTTSPQVAPVATPDRGSPKRTILEDAAKNFERLAASEKDAGKRAGYLEQARVIRKRLTDGDFQAGHRILLFVTGDSALSDTFTVRSDQKLQLPNLPEISLAGVLDSELQGYLQTKLAQYIRDPSVRAQTMLRVQVSGDVGKPGFYSLPIDTPISDVIMNAGGPSTSADMSKTELRRGSAVVVKREGIQAAIRSEFTMSDIGARPGDELFVPGKPAGSRWTKIGAVAAAVSSIAFTVFWIAGR
jgi:protein involved in polysaccharide export with SLBB domain